MAMQDDDDDAMAHSVPTQDPVISTRGQPWPAADPSSERIGQPSRSDNFPYVEPAHEPHMLTQPRTIGIGAGAALSLAGAIGGAWLYARWQRERNKPINRFRRRARQTASSIRKRVPTSREDVARPALSLSAAVLSSLVVIWQQAQARRKDADKLVSDVNWQKQLTQLKKRWSPRRLELEKISISRR